MTGGSFFRRRFEGRQQARLDQPVEHLLRFTALVGEGGQELVSLLEGSGSRRGDQVAEDLTHDRDTHRADGLERRLCVLGKRPGDAADLLVAPPREQAALAIPVLPETRHRKREQRQRPALLRHVTQHVVDEPLILEPVPESSAGCTSARRSAAPSGGVSGMSSEKIGRRSSNA